MEIIKKFKNLYGLVVLALSKYLIRDTPLACHCLLTLASSFSLVISSLVSSQRSFAVYPCWFSNNATCMSVINSQHSRNVFMQRCLRELWLLLALHNIKLIVRSVRGCDNWLADSLSRFHTGKYCHRFKSLAEARSLTECTLPNSFFTFTLE